MKLKVQCIAMTKVFKSTLDACETKNRYRVLFLVEKRQETFLLEQVASLGPSCQTIPDTLLSQHESCLASPGKDKVTVVQLSPGKEKIVQLLL